MVDDKEYVSLPRVPTLLMLAAAFGEIFNLRTELGRKQASILYDDMIELSPVAPSFKPVEGQQDGRCRQCLLPLEPIEGAPQDGTPFLAYENGRYYKCWMEYFSRGDVYAWQDMEDSEPSPTHWTHLPVAPEVQA